MTQLLTSTETGSKKVEGVGRDSNLQILGGNGASSTAHVTLRIEAWLEYVIAWLEYVMTPVVRTRSLLIQSPSSVKHEKEVINIWVKIIYKWICVRIPNHQLVLRFAHFIETLIP